MANLSRRLVRAAPQFSIQNDSAANSGSQRHANDRRMSAPRPLPHLSNRRGIGVVFNYDGQVEFLLNCRRQPKAIQTGKIWSFYNDPCADVHGSRHHDRYSSNSLAGAFLSLGFARRLDHLR